MDRYEWVSPNGFKHELSKDVSDGYPRYFLELGDHKTEFFNCGVAVELLRLAQWKAEAIKVESTWDAQAVAKLIGLPPGRDIRSAIQPAIEALQQENERLRKALEKIANYGHAECLRDNVRSEGELNFSLQCIADEALKTKESK